MRGIHDALITGVGVAGGHVTALDPDGLVQHVNDRCQTVGGAGRVGDHRIVCGQAIVVDPVDDGAIRVAAGGGNQHFLGPGGQMLARAVFLGEASRALHHHVDAQLAPGQLGRVGLGQQPNPLTADHEGVFALDADVHGQLAVHGIPLEQVGHLSGIGEIVDGDELEVVARAFQCSAEGEASDAAEAIDGDFRGHGVSCSGSGRRCGGRDRAAGLRGPQSGRRETR